MAVRICINDDKNILNHLMGILSMQEKGEFFINGLANIKFQFDTQSGTIMPVSAEGSTGVTTFFNPVLFGHITAPASSIMGLLARRELLKGLNQLGDSDISRIINRHRIDEVKTIKEMNSEVNQALKEMIKLIKPEKKLFPGFFNLSSKALQERSEVHGIIFEVINRHYLTLRSKDEASALVSHIKESLGAKTPKNDPRWV